MNDWHDDGLFVSDIEKIHAENQRQLRKWGFQTHRPEEWLMYLTEEVGELAKAMSEYKYNRGGTAEDIEKEAVQVATLAAKMARMAVKDR